MTDTGDWKSRVRALLTVALVACGSDDPAGAPSQDLEPLEKQLESIGYVNIVPAPQSGREGVVHFDPAAAAPGWNLFNLRQESVARVMAMDGQVVHRIHSEVHGQTYERFRKLLPSYLPGYLKGWNHIELGPDDDLFVIGTHHMLLRLGWDSALQWKLDLSAHHDLALDDDGRIYVLTDSLRVNEAVAGTPIVFQDNQITVVTPDGRIERSISLFDAFRDRPEREILERLIERIPASQVKRLESFRARVARGGAETHQLVALYAAAVQGEIRDEAGIKNVLFHGHDEDIFHANSIQVLPRDLPGLWRKGNLLVSIRSLNRIAVVDEASGRVIWTFGGGVLEAQHDATWLADGSILLFDNGPRRGFSRVLRIDPQRREVVWEYRGDPPESLFSAASSGVQALPNGNLLVTVTESGRAFEVTAEREIVWDYYSKLLRAEPGQPSMRGAIYRMKRLPSDAISVP